MQIHDANLVIEEYNKLLSQANKEICLLRAYAIELERKNDSLAEELRKVTNNENN